MKTLHEKSPCCWAKIYKFGNKRRQCSKCEKTWTVWAKRRGRNPSRPNHNLIKKVLVEKRSLFLQRASKKKITNAALSIRFKKALINYLHNSAAPTVSGRKLILVNDALWFKFLNRRWTLYLAVVKPVNKNKAVILDPMLFQGYESFTDWNHYLDSIPQNIKKRIKAMVSDGFRGVDRIAKEHNWILQRCHFHLIAQLQINRGYHKKFADAALREEIYQSIVKLLIIKKGKKLLEKHLLSLIKKSNCPKRLRTIASDFLQNLEKFRNYINYPNLKIPITTNSVESLNKIIRSRCKHLRTPDSMFLRVKVLLRIKKIMACNPKNFQQN